MNGSTEFYYIPNELLFEIFTFCSDLMSVSMTCKKFHEIINCDSFTKWGISNVFLRRYVRRIKHKFIPRGFGINLDLSQRRCLFKILESITGFVYGRKYLKYIRNQLKGEYIEDATLNFTTVQFKNSMTCFIMKRSQRYAYSLCLHMFKILKSVFKEVVRYNAGFSMYDWAKPLMKFRFSDSKIVHIENEIAQYYPRNNVSGLLLEELAELTNSGPIFHAETPSEGYVKTEGLDYCRMFGRKNRERFFDVKFDWCCI